MTAGTRYSHSQRAHAASIGSIPDTRLRGRSYTKRSGRVRNATWQGSLGCLLWHRPLPVLKGTFITGANTSLLNLELEQKFKASGGALQKRCILTTAVLLAHWLALVWTYPSQSNGQATKKPPGAAKPLTDISLKSLAAVALGVSFRKRTVSTRVLRVPAHRCSPHPRFLKRCPLKPSGAAEAPSLGGACHPSRPAGRAVSTDNPPALPGRRNPGARDGPPSAAAPGGEQVPAASPGRRAEPGGGSPARLASPRLAGGAGRPPPAAARHRPPPRAELPAAASGA